VCVCVCVCVCMCVHVCVCVVSALFEYVHEALGIHVSPHTSMVWYVVSITAHEMRTVTVCAVFTYLLPGVCMSCVGHAL